MTRIVGQQDRDEFVLDPDLAWQRGRALVIRALSFLPSSAELRAEWFSTPADEPENIRIADDLLVDLLFAANGETFESLRPHVRRLNVEGVDIQTLDIEGLLKTKTDYRDKDRIDREVLSRLKLRLAPGES